jgi:hypothetical protein
MSAMVDPGCCGLAGVEGLCGAEGVAGRCGAAACACTTDGVIDKPATSARIDKCLIAA